MKKKYFRNHQFIYAKKAHKIVRISIKQKKSINVGSKEKRRKKVVNVK